MNQEDLFVEDDHTPIEFTLEQLETYLASGQVSEENVIGVLARAKDDINLKRMFDAYVSHVNPTNKREFAKTLKTKIETLRLTSIANNPIYTNNKGIWLRNATKMADVCLANFCVTQRKILHGTSGSQNVLWTIKYFNPVEETLVETDIVMSGTHLARSIDLQVKIAERFIDARIDKTHFERLLEFVNDPLNVPLTNVISQSRYGFHIHHKKPYLLHAKRVETAYGDKIESQILGDPLPHEVIYAGSGPDGLYELHHNETSHLNDMYTHFTGMTNPTKANAILGWAIASMIKDQISSRVVECRLPILFVYGNREVGKSVLITSLMRTLGWAGLQGNGEEIGLRGTSVAQMRDILCSYDSMPVIFGEFRISNTNTEALTKDILLLYDGMSSTKKGAKEQGRYESVSQSYTAPLVILGNDLIQDEAAKSRLLVMHMETTDRAGEQCGNHMNEMRRLPAGSVGYEIYSWLLNNWNTLGDIIDEGAEFVDNLNLPLQSRAKSTAICVTIGLKLLEKMGVSIHETTIKECLEWLANDLVSRRSETMAARFINYLADNHDSGRARVINRIESSNTMLFDKDWISKFRSSLLYGGFTEVPDVDVLRDQISSEAKGLKFNHPATIDKKTVRMIQLDATVVQQVYKIDCEVWEPTTM
ncbi:hypothetical protein D3C78_20090 [compost metagenome]